MSKLLVCLFALQWGTHRSRTGIRDPPLVFYPSVVGSLLVGIRSVKSSSYVRHAVHTHCRATENGAGRKIERRDRVKAREEKERPRVEFMMVWWILNLPGGGEDCIHYGVFVISGREQKYVLYKREGKQHKEDLLFLLLLPAHKTFSSTSIFICIYMKQQLQSDNCLLWQLFLLEMWSLSKVNSEGSFWKVKAPLLTHIFTFYFHSYLRSSSKCVSTPCGPGIEHTSLALRKVVHLLVRLLSPPTSFWNTTIYTVTRP